MKLVISTENDRVSKHFGRCPEYTVVEIENAKVKSKKVIQNPGHAPGALPKYFNELGCEIIIAGGMGRRAQQHFKQYGLDWIIGIQGKVDDVIKDYLEDNLQIGDSTCEHGEGKGPGFRSHL